MAVIEIREATRAGARLVIGVAGVSGSGKTYTALELAYGLANYRPRKVGFLDSENKRGSLYANIFREHPTHPSDEPFLIADLYPPFTPERYQQAVLDFQKAGVEVLVIDTVSHEWNGLGGYLDMKAQAGAAGSLKIKPQHKRFVNALLQSDMHIIVCVRATNKLDWTDKKNPRPLGFQPVQEPEFMFEMTASLMMWDEGKSQDVVKCPAELRGILGRTEGYITATDGAALRAWVDGGVALDPRVEHAKNSLRTVTERGMDALVAAWRAIDADVRNIISPDGKCPEEYKLAAIEFERQSKTSGQQEVDDINSDLMGDGNGGEAGE